jgi:hypothetical protein
MSALSNALQMRLPDALTEMLLTQASVCISRTPWQPKLVDGAPAMFLLSP